MGSFVFYGHLVWNVIFSVSITNSSKYNGMSDSNTADNIAGIGYLLVIAVVAWIIASIFGFNYHSTSEGTTDYSDCREVIQLDADSWHTYFGTFIGQTIKTNSGRTMGGEFVNIKNDSSLFGNSHTCARAYIYQKKQDDVCSESNPYLGYDDLCYTTSQIYR